MEKKHFIFTTDKETAEALKALDFELIQQTADGYLFYNDAEIPSSFSQNKVTYTNKIFI